MKSVVDKVKDIVEICPFTQLDDFAADPGLTLSGYHFTDITSDLMAKWVDRLAAVKPGDGCALALAGFRGVGKSHFLAVIAAVIANPELRARIRDPHMAAAADRLTRRHNPVAFVRRGSGPTLIDELKQAIGKVLNLPPGTLSDSADELLAKGSEHAGEMPLVLLVDTALDRVSRVARNDGILLSEVAELAKKHGIFLGVALDDDISGADGANSSIAGNFSIDYLDQEHLYKIVDTHIFAKQSQKLPVLHEIYEEYRSVLPGFRWSEQRFSSLYPLHPATLEIAPIIRLYIPDFALLGFASEAGLKILGRPANSLIGLDEIFDGVEKKLRAVAELTEVFAAFDKLQDDVVAKTPVNVRLHAKLILKGFFLLSLDGQGSTAAEIAASMMIVDEQIAGANAINVTALLNRFASAMPTMIDRTTGENAKYRFKLTEETERGDILAAAAKRVPDDVISNWLLRLVSEKFTDVEMSTSGLPTECSVEWRGGIRRGEIRWHGGTGGDTIPDNRDPVDWTVIIVQGGRDDDPSSAPGHVIGWKFATLTDEEKDTIRSHHVLQTDGDVRESLGDQLTTALQGYSIAAEKIWYRVVLRDALLVDETVEYPFDEAIRSIHSLGQLLTRSLAPIFASRFPSHPQFQELLDARVTSGLITSFLSGGDIDNIDVQRMAGAIAAPLGLAVKSGDRFIPTTDVELIELDHIKAAISMQNDGEARIPIERVSSLLQASPFGLTREARQLIASALVAQRQFEFVTSSGDRISHRSLDLQIIWDDIIGLAKPLNEAYPAERLLSWAKLITGNKEIRSLDNANDRSMVILSLNQWLASWRDTSVIDRFDALGDEDLNAGIWKSAVHLRKSYGAVAELIVAVSDGDISVEKFLQSAADVFSDSEAEFAKKADDLRLLSNFLESVAARNEINAYLSVCEITDDAKVETARQMMLDRLHFTRQAEALTLEIKELWKSFKASYIEYYAVRHDSVMQPAAGQSAKEIVGNGEWPIFEGFSTNPLFDTRSTTKVRALMREIRQMYCTADVREVLARTPTCTCSFELNDHVRMTAVVEEIYNHIRTGLNRFSSNVINAREHLMKTIDAISAGDARIEGVASLREKLAGLNSVIDLDDWSTQDCRLLKLVAEHSTRTPPHRALNTSDPTAGSSEAIGLDAIDWDQELEPAYIHAKL